MNYQDMPHIIDLHFLEYPEVIAAFLVETEDGPVLVETGPHATFPALEKGVNGLGYEIKDIKHVLLTHIHLDHAGAAWTLAENGANIYVHPIGLPHLADPSKLMHSARRIYKEDMDRLWGDMQAIPQAQLHEVADRQSIEIGGKSFRAWHTPGHASHHIAWQLEEAIFTGDNAGAKIGSGPVVPPCPPPDIDIEAWQQSIALIKALNPKVLYLTHFGPVTNPSEHLDQVESVLLKWANWIRPFWEAGKEPGEVKPLFEDYVSEQLQAAGITGRSKQQYEAANPSWMSVTGLMRYWRKRHEKATGA